jgi:hypothetical protein
MWSQKKDNYKMNKANFNFIVENNKIDLIKNEKKFMNMRPKFEKENYK